MKICFPVQSNEGMQSRVFDHFGSAPAFIIVDVTNNTLSSIPNKDQHHAHGQCNPIRALDSHQVDAVIAGGIGGGALNRLNQAGIRVFQAGASGVRENMDLFLEGRLAEFTLQQCCGGQTGGSGCHH